MSWVLPFLFMQLILKTRNILGGGESARGNFSSLDMASLGLFFLFASVAIGRFLLNHSQTPLIQGYKKRLLHDPGKASE